MNHYCLPPNDGNIYCRVCGEKLLNEEFTTYEGMDNNNKVIKSNEELNVDEGTIELSEEENSFKSKIISIMNTLSIQLYENDIINIINYIKLIDHETITYNRYNYNVFKDHKKMKDINKIKKKIDKDREIKKFKKYITDINEILSIYILILFTIQFRSEYKIYNRYSIIKLEDYSWKNLHSTNNYSSINLNILNSIDKVIRDLIKSKYKLWLPFQDFYKEIDEDGNNFNYQMISIIKIYLSPEMDIYSKFEDLSNDNILYINDYWSSYKPLHTNEMILNINKDIIKENIILISDDILFNIGEELIINNPTYIRLYDYSLSLHGEIKDNNLLYLLIKNLLNYIPESLVKDIWDENKLNKPIIFNNLKKNIIIDILENQNDNIYTPLFINYHFNNMIYKLLISPPYRYYENNIPNIYLNDDFTNLSVEKKNTMWNNFCIDDIGELIKNINNNNYINNKVVDFKLYYPEKCDKLDMNNDNFNQILSFIQYKNISIPINQEEYLYENRLLKFINSNIIEEISLNKIIDDINQYKNDNKINLKESFLNNFDRILLLTNEYILNIKKYLSEIKPSKEQDFRFNNIFKLPGINLYKSFELFQNIFNNNDNIHNYISQIYNLKLILSKIKNNNKLANYYIPENWKLSDTNYKYFSDYYFKNDLLLHENKMKNHKYNYKGFQLYLEEDFTIQLIDSINLLKNIDLLIGSENQLFNTQYSIILIKYLYISILNDLIYHINMIDNDKADQLFIDIYINLLEEFTDQNWIFQMNDELLNINLTKQKERERNELVNQLTEMQNDQRMVKNELQKIGDDSLYHEAEKYHQDYLESDESAAYNINERTNYLKELVNTGEIDPSLLQNLAQSPEDTDLYNLQPNDDDAHEDDLDTIHE